MGQFDLNDYVVELYLAAACCVAIGACVGVLLAWATWL